MAINSLTASSDKIPLLSLCSHSSRGSIGPKQLVKLNIATDSSVTSSIKKSDKIRKKSHSKSPYLSSDKVHLLSRVTEQRVIQNKAADFGSSFPLAVEIYKANSDEFKKHNKKRVKKSVLTLPNAQAPAPQTCTVSDMNDSEDFNHEDDNRKRRPKKRPTGLNRKARNNFEFYDRDARYCSQFNIHLDCSSTDVIRNFNGVGKQSLKRKKQFITPKRKIEGKLNGNEVWKVLRNINRFQFRPSPPMSDESIPVQRKKDKQMRFNRKDTRFIETCRMEEFAYISSIEVDNKSPTSVSHSSSFDRVTVIDKEDQFSKICDEFEKSLSQMKNTRNSKNQKVYQSKNKSLKQKLLRTTKKAPRSKECNQFSTINNKLLYLSSHGNSPSFSEYSNSVDNQDFLKFNIDEDTQQNIHVHNLKPNNTNHQLQSTMDLSEIEKKLKSPAISISSKTGMKEAVKDYGKVFENYQGKCSQPLNGITKVVLSKDEDAVPAKHLETKRKSRLPITLTNASILPKLTKTEIKRRLLNMKFPIVILGKDQVSSTIQVMDYDPPHFEGLDKHIWPFMIEWSDDSKLKVEVEDRLISQDINNFDAKYNADITVPKKGSNFHGDNKSKKGPEIKVEIPAFKRPNNVERKVSIESKVAPNTRGQIPVDLSSDINSYTHQPKKSRSIHHFKDRMLNFLYKKPPVTDSSEVNHKITGQCGVNKDVLNDIEILDNTDDCLNKPNKSNNMLNDYNKGKYLNTPNTKLIDHRSVVFKRPWSKAKWASDFIENVIKKMKNGVYYSQDLKYDSKNLLKVAKEVSVQTRLFSENFNRLSSNSETNHLCEQSSIKRKDQVRIIPGFDNSLPELEVQTFDTNKIEIKNCVTNIIVRFDITVPRESDALCIHTKKSCSLIPLEKNDSNIRLFKCKATIVNAMLPAELCSILPDMMRTFVHSDIIKPNNPLPINKTDSQLSTISELSHFEGFDPNKTISIQYILSPDIRHLLEGQFAPKRGPTFYKIKSIAFQSLEIVKNLLPQKITIAYVFNSMVNIRDMEYTNILSGLHKHNNEDGLQNNICTTLESYNYQKHALIPYYQRFNLWKIFENMCATFKMFGYENFRDSSMRICTISIDIPIIEIIDTKKVISLSNLKLDSIFANYGKINFGHKTLHGKDDLPEASDSNVSSGGSKSLKRANHINGSNHKIKKKGFVKLYKKCKSTSNIPNEKNNFSLSKITCLDDFFQLLGSKTLSCVCDGNSGKKILSSVITMKNWITEINSRQALLVLLLANKKDTTNLIRFRPVLLQGIAVNRITRTSELDMEIEIIEREKLNGFSQFDGISYLPASTENKDNLLEELQWIAKTTASDYQRPFDESSEKLLKSLLEKRKQLNPSYLRVMARYVGLGLLKSSTKKINL